MELDAKIEAILFWKGESVSIAELARFLKVPTGEIKQGLRTLEEKLSGRGIALIRTDNELALATAPEVSSLIAEFQKEELSRELSKAALETLAIILYRSPLSRREIEYIRGVNSVSMLRTLLMRGLIERGVNTNDERVFLYKPTIELLAELGIRGSEELPEFEEIKKELDSFKETEKETEEEKQETGNNPRNNDKSET